MEIISQRVVSKKSHSISIKEYPNLVTAMVVMPMDEYVKYIDHGIEVERKALHALMTTIFKGEINGKHIFYDEDGFNEFIQTRGLKGTIGGGNYSKTAIFEIDVNNFEKSLSAITDYITRMSDEYENIKLMN